MKKTRQKKNRESIVTVQEKELAVATGGSGYVVAYDDGPPDGTPPPTGGG